MKNKKVKINFFIPRILPNSRRGLSTVVTSLIIILLVLVAVGIIWIVIMKIISSGTEQVSLGKLTMNLEIKKVEVHDAGIDVQVKRNTGAGELSGIKFIVSDGVDTQIFEMPTTMGELATKRFTLAYTGLVKKVSIAGIFETSSGKEFTGNEIDNFEFSNKEIIKNLGGISWWRFENNAVDEIGGNDGTLVNMEEADWVDGRVGKCLDFDGVNEYVSIGTVAALTEGTLSIWFRRVENKVGLQMLITDGNSQLEFEFSENNLAFYINNSILDIGTYTDANWHHFIGTFSSTGNYQRGYIDGVYRAGTTYPGEASAATKYIGSRAGNYGFHGLIDEPMIFNKALSEKQVKALYELDLS